MTRLQTRERRTQVVRAAYRATRHGQLPARAFNESLPEGIQRIHPDIEKMTLPQQRFEAHTAAGEIARGPWRQFVLKKIGILDQRLRRPLQGLLQSGDAGKLGMLRQCAHETRALAGLGHGRLQPRERDARGLRTQVVLRGTQMRGDGFKARPQRGLEAGDWPDGELVEGVHRQPLSRMRLSRLDVEQSLIFDLDCALQQRQVEGAVRIQFAGVKLFKLDAQFVVETHQRAAPRRATGRQQVRIALHADIHRRLGMVAKPGAVIGIDDLIEACGNPIHGASMISKSWVIVAVLPSMIEAEQYFSADSLMAFSTRLGSSFFPVTLKCT